jgi:YbbR domain-containing protein
MFRSLNRSSIHFGRGDLIRFGASLVLAILLWGWVTTSKDPQTDRGFANVAVAVGEPPSPLTVVGTIPDVTVQVSGPRSVVRDLTSNDVKPSLDLGGIDSPGDYTVSVDVQTPRGIWRSTVVPSHIPIHVEESITKQFVIETAISGNVDTTRQIGASVVDASEANVVGATSSVQRIAKVIAPVAIANQTRDFTSAVTLQAVDSTGQPIPEVKVSPEIVTVNVNINARGKRVAVLTQLNGEPAQGYEVVDRTLNPATVLVDGPDDAIAQLISVTTEPIDISGATDTLSRSAQITGLPDGVHVIEPADAIVDVVIQIRQIGVRQPLPAQTVQVVGLGPGLVARVTPEAIAVTVVANEDVLSTLTTNDLTIQVNVTGLGPGVYHLKPVVALPANVTWIDSDSASVTVSIGSSATPVASPVASPSPLK